MTLAAGLALLAIAYAVVNLRVRDY